MSLDQHFKQGIIIRDLSVEERERKGFDPNKYYTKELEKGIDSEMNAVKKNLLDAAEAQEIAVNFSILIDMAANRKIADPNFDFSSFLQIGDIELMNTLRRGYLQRIYNGGIREQYWPVHAMKFLLNVKNLFPEIDMEKFLSNSLPLTPADYKSWEGLEKILAQHEEMILSGNTGNMGNDVTRGYIKMLACLKNIKPNWDYKTEGEAGPKYSELLKQAKSLLKLFGESAKDKPGTEEDWINVLYYQYLFKLAGIEYGDKYRISEYVFKQMIESISAADPDEKLDLIAEYKVAYAKEVKMTDYGLEISMEDEIFNKEEPKMPARRKY